MSFDLSRKKFNPLDDYFSVVMQQGRVQTDADWNTLVDQLNRHMQAESLDTFGPSVVPRETADGFLISGSADAIEIGAGRIYVDGLLAENHTDTLKWDARLAEISGTAKLSGANINAAPSGLPGTTAYDAQPYYPNPPALPEGESYLMYVDVWQRDITYLQDASLVDAAVGVDTTARQQTVWQVKFLDDVGALAPTVTDVDIPGWLETIHPSSARLSTDTGNLTDDDNPCLLPPQAGYKGLENQLYRVQVHDSGPVGTATFKWSRDNAVVSSRISAITGGNNIVVDSLGRDDVLSFHEGDWVEITDDHRGLMGLPGELRRIRLGDGIDSATRTITLEGDPLPTGAGNGEFPIDGSDQTEPTRNTRIIRWDHAGIVFRENESEYTDLDAATSSGAIEIPAAGTRLFLEKGILVDFDLESVVDEADFAPEYKTGDYWVFSARVNDASIEQLDRAPPMGIHHHYAKLAIVNSNGITDCRTLWPPEAGGEGCACTICVHPDTHNNGSATIQQAIDQVITQGGGTVCLSVGEYQISQPIRITGQSVTLRGQGWQTRLISRQAMSLIEIGGDDSIATDITVEKLFVLTAVAQGFNTAITVNNVIALNLIDCFIINLAVGDATSHGIQFTGLAILVTVQKCNIAAERGIIGPRLQDEFLGTLNFSLTDCLLSCSTQGISFTGTSFHLGKLDMRHNHIGNADNAGIELTGATLDNTAVTIENNLLTNCQNGIRSGVSNLRILCNDLEVDDDTQDSGHAIAFVEGLDPEDSANQQVIGNRIRNYRGHAITVQAGVGKMMVKQNQLENISGSAFIVEEDGSIEYLSLENNQFNDVAGIMSAETNTLAAVLLHACVRADITNNVFDGVVRTSYTATIRTGIAVINSGAVRITGNRLLAVTPASYTGYGTGIFMGGRVGDFEVNNNEISRIPQRDDMIAERRANAEWKPLYVLMGGGTLRGEAAGSSIAATGSAPLISVNNRNYAVLATRLLNLSATNNISVNGNCFDGTSGISAAVEIVAPMYCGFIDNEVKSETPMKNELVSLSADHVGANNNRLMSRDDQSILTVQARRYVVMGNMTTGNIIVNSGAASAGAIPLPEPWKSLNINI
ncbi:MAG: right-handed parallel beta-helix repeat-containing protein [Gammaproteobacteria bacterium]|nr:right-handed parallel beta-helix repeat-containing protein [Gammaproteobacteria bacterium]